MYICEYLPRLNSISVTLLFPFDIQTITSISCKDNYLNIKSNENFKILLPIEGQFKLHQMQKSNNLLLISLKNLSTSSSIPDNFMVNDLQWSCKDLLKTPKNQSNSNTFEFICKNCKSVIVTSKNKFNDMPSEMWAELMDLWHCHKPHNAQQHETSKKYGSLSPVPNQVIIGSFYLLVNKENIIVTDGICKCGFKIGNMEGNHIKLMKWNLQLKYNDNLNDNTCNDNSSHEVIESYPEYYYVYNQILDKINLNASRRLIIGKYLIWIFNIGLDITIDGTKLTKCLKVCYTPWQDKPIDEEITIHDNVLLMKFYQQMEHIHHKLPEDSNKMILKEDDKEIVYNITYLGLQ